MEDINADQICQQAEWTRCAESFPYFCEKYVRVMHPIKGVIPFVLYPYQVEYAEKMGRHRFLINKKFRQGGFTTTEGVWSLWGLIFHDAGPVLHLCKTDSEAIALSRLVKFVLLNLPDWLTPKLEKNNDHELSFGGDKQMFFMSPMGCRGRSVKRLFIHEAAYIRDMDTVWNSVFPCIGLQGKVIISSTLNSNDPEKPDWFLKTYLNALEVKNSFEAVDIPYISHPDYKNPVWKEEVRKNLGQRIFDKEIGCIIKDKVDPPQHKPAFNLATRGGMRVIHRDENQPFVDCTDSNVMWEPQPDLRNALLKDVRGRKNNLSKKGTWSRSKAEALTSCKSDVEHPLFPEPLSDDPKDYKKLLDSITEVVGEQKEETRSDGLEPDGTVCFDYLKLAGILPEDAEEDDPCEFGHHKVAFLRNIAKSFDKDLNLGIEGRFLTVNGVPTKIKTKVIEMAFNGLFELSGKRKAMAAITKLVRRKLKVLF